MKWLQLHYWKVILTTLLLILATIEVNGRCLGSACANQKDLHNQISRKPNPPPSTSINLNPHPSNASPPTFLQKDFCSLRTTIDPYQNGKMLVFVQKVYKVPMQPSREEFQDFAKENFSESSLKSLIDPRVSMTARTKESDKDRISILSGTAQAQDTSETEGTSGKGLHSDTEMTEAVEQFTEQEVKENKEYLENTVNLIFNKIDDPDSIHELRSSDTFIQSVTDYSRSVNGRTVILVYRTRHLRPADVNSNLKKFNLGIFRDVLVATNYLGAPADDLESEIDDKCQKQNDIAIRVLSSTMGPVCFDTDQMIETILKKFHINLIQVIHDTNHFHALAFSRFNKLKATKHYRYACREGKDCTTINFQSIRHPKKAFNEQLEDFLKLVKNNFETFPS